MKLLLILTSSLMFLVSCENSTDIQAKDSKPENEQMAPKKLKANPETAEGMLMIQHMIISFNEMQEENKNYALLLGELSYQCDYIIKNCSMKGSDHEELHKILEPILVSIQQAKNAETNEAIAIELESIVENTELFFDRFEAEAVDV